MFYRILKYFAVIETPFSFTHFFLSTKLYSGKRPVYMQKLIVFSLILKCTSISHQKTRLRSLTENFKLRVNSEILRDRASDKSGHVSPSC